MGLRDRLLKKYPDFEIEFDTGWSLEDKLDTITLAPRKIPTLQIYVYKDGYAAYREISKLSIAYAENIEVAVADAISCIALAIEADEKGELYS